MVSHSDVISNYFNVTDREPKHLYTPHDITFTEMKVNMNERNNTRKFGI